MLILHDPTTLLHRTVELLGGKLVPAYESPERVTSILASLSEESSNPDDRFRYDVRIMDTSFDPSKIVQLQHILSTTHDVGYLTHLRDAHREWVRNGLIAQDENVLPECFVFPTISRSGNPPKPPRDVFARAGYYAFDMSSGISVDTYRSAIASVRLAVEGVRLLTKPSDAAGGTGLDRSSAIVADVFALTRPPGHHCDTRRAGGYCYLNNAIVAVRGLQDQQPDARIGILDLDFHHGNGTQEYFLDSSHKGENVMYVSVHGEGEFPYYTGSEDEVRLVPQNRQASEVKDGSEPFINMNINLPLPTNSSAEDYFRRLEEGLDHLELFNPHFLLLSLGFDTFHLDPLGSFEIDVADYRQIAGRVRERLRHMPTLILLEGGYVVDRLGKCVKAFLEGWEVASREV